MNAAGPHLFQGRIIWREIPNRIGDGEKLRPLVTISSTSDIQARDSVICVACSNSTALRQPLPPNCVLIPPKIGKRSTKLPKPTAAVCDWIVEIPKSDIGLNDLAGSTGENVLRDILQLSKQFVEASTKSP